METTSPAPGQDDADAFGEAETDAPPVYNNRFAVLAHIYLDEPEDTSFVPIGAQLPDGTTRQLY